MKTHRRNESGQAVILLTLAIVALLGFTALAVDGSMVYSDRRFAQSAVDASALAGASAAAQVIYQQGVTQATWNCNSATLQSAISAASGAAISRAASNSFTIDNDAADNHGVATTCVNSGTEKYLDVLVRITQDTPTAFAQTIMNRPLRNVVTAVARVRPRKALAFGYTIVALNPAACSGQSNGATFHGNPDVTVCGGGIFSNGCLRGNGNIDVYVKDFNCSGVASSGIFYATEVTGASKFHPNPQSAAHISANAYALDFTPQELCNRPGAHIVNASDLPSVLSPGLWCINGSVGLHGNKGGQLHGEGVTLVFLNGGLSCNGNCDFRISAPTASPDPYPAVPGLLIYSMASSSWKLNGNNVSYFRGTILLPNADVTLTGTGNENSFMTQVITWNFEGGGTNDSTYKWNDNWMYTEPVTVELNK